MYKCVKQKRLLYFTSDFFINCKKKKEKSASVLLQRISCITCKNYIILFFTGNPPVELNSLESWVNVNRFRSGFSSRRIHSASVQKLTKIKFLPSSVQSFGKWSPEILGFLCSKNLNVQILSGIFWHLLMISENSIRQRISGEEHCGKQWKREHLQRNHAIIETFKYKAQLRRVFSCVNNLRQKKKERIEKGIGNDNFHELLLSFLFARRLPAHRMYLKCLESA